MKGFVIAIVAGTPMLVLVAIVLRACSVPTEESARRSHPVAAEVDMRAVEQMPARGDNPAMPSQSSVSVDRAMSISEPTDEDPSAAMARNGSLEDPSASEPQADVEADPDKPVDSQMTPGERLTLDQTATSSTSRRNADYPRTYISSIRVDLTSPNHGVRLTWAGPEAASQETGPFHSSPGRGLGNNDCDDFDESNRDGSNCTPKGTMQVQGFSDSMPMYSHCRFVTWFQIARGIAFHYYPSVPDYPASHGCIRFNAHAAQLIHNNSKIGATEVKVDGKWEFVQ